MDRRKFLQHTAGIMAFSSLPVSILHAYDNTTEPDPTKNPDPVSGLTQPQWVTISSIQQHLLPSNEDSPGAKEINADKFLHFVLTRREFDSKEKSFLIQGLIDFEEICLHSFDNKFHALDSPLKEQALRKMETTHHGQDWIYTLLIYLIEALLGDPVYGGNCNVVGWKWLDIQPGFPQPPENKRYHLL